MIKEASQQEKPSENVIDLLETKMTGDKKLKEIGEEILLLLQATQILEKLKERTLLRRIVGEKKIIEASELYDKVIRDPRIRKS